jgi:hypothetical protein
MAEHIKCAAYPDSSEKWDVYFKTPISLSWQASAGKGCSGPASFEGLELSFSWKRRMCGLVPASFSALPFQ